MVGADECEGKVVLGFLLWFALFGVLLGGALLAHRSFFMCWCSGERW